MKAISRRDLFRSFFGQNQKNGSPAGVVQDQDKSPWPPTEEPEITRGSEGAQPLALILDRFCLAWQGSFCSVCVERCPEPGAILTEKGKPRVNPDLCTGCAICHEVCPAPKNAVFLVTRKPRPGMIGRTIAETQPTPDV
jgi:ferredoxin